MVQLPIWISTKSFSKSMFVTLIIPIDYQKAFDTINHNILLQKLKVIKFQNTVFSGLGPGFVNEYFWQKRSFSELNRRIYSFCIYVNNVHKEGKSNLLLCADDSCLIYQHKDITEIEKRFVENFNSECQ